MDNSTDVYLRYGTVTKLKSVRVGCVMLRLREVAVIEKIYEIVAITNSNRLLNSNDAVCRKMVKRVN